MIKPRAQREGGFTLIEVIVALAILAVSLGALLKIFSSHLIQTSEMEAETVANSLLQSMLNGLGKNQPLVDGDTAGRFTNGFTWRLHIAPYGTPEDQSAWSVSAHQVVAEVDWMNGGRPRSATLETLRLAPKVPAP
jgi:general secretion pathway protein I